MIAQRCSVTEAYLAAFGKEIGDLLGNGDAEWRDVHADRRGIACARRVDSQTALLECCTT